MEAFENKIKSYESLNKISKKGGVVFLGSSVFDHMNVEELAMSNSLGVPVYNRSFENLRLSDCDEVISDCIKELQPSKVFVNIGENDLASSNFEFQEFIAKYEWMLLNLHRTCKGCRIYVVSIISDNPNTSFINKQLEDLCKNNGCTFINVEGSAKHDYGFLHIFGRLKSYIRNFPLTFADAMQM